MRTKEEDEIKIELKCENRTLYGKKDSKERKDIKNLTKGRKEGRKEGRKNSIES
jgi:hypothetical protein